MNKNNECWLGVKRGGVIERSIAQLGFRIIRTRSAGSEFGEGE
jgi:hypothetical protein